MGVIIEVRKRAALSSSASSTRRSRTRLPFGRFCHRGLDPSSFGSTLVLKFQDRPSPLLYYSWWSRAQHGLCGRRWCLRWRIQLCWTAGPPLGNRLCACAQSGDLALEGCISSLTGSLPLGHEGRGQASPVVHSWHIT